MRGIGDPRAIAVLASLPQRGLRGCTIVPPSFFLRSSFSGAAGRGGGPAGRGGGIGSAEPSDGGGAGRGASQQEDGNGSPDETTSGRFAERSSGAPIRVNPNFVQQEPRGGAAPPAGLGRGATLPPLHQDAAREEESSSFGRGQGMSPPPPSDSGRGRWIPPIPKSLHLGGGVGRGIPQRATDIPRSAASDEIPRQQKLGLGQNESVIAPDQPLPSTPQEPKRSAVEELLAKLGSQNPQIAKPTTPKTPAPVVERNLPSPKPLKLGSQSPPETSVNPESPPSVVVESQASENPKIAAPVVEPQLPLRMPFARPASPTEQQQSSSPPPPRPIFQAQPAAPSGPLGRGRGQPGAVTQPGIGAEPEEVQTQPRQAERVPERARRGRPRPPNPPRMQLSVEEARARAIEILEKGIEKNVAAEGERRRRAGMEKFADATEFLADRFNRPSGPSPSSQPQRSRTERPGGDSRRRDRPRRQRSDEDAMALSESSEVTQLTPEQEAQLVRFQQEDTFKDRLHTLFLTQFEPEFAMEEFGRNPDIDEPPVLGLEEYLQGYKQFFLPEGAEVELSQEQKWQEAVKTSLANAPDLEKLVEAYGGPGRMTARQQIEKLRNIHQKLPPTVPPEVSAFTQRAFLTLQNNPRLNMHQKEKLMSNIVSGFS